MSAVALRALLAFVLPALAAAAGGCELKAPAAAAGAQGGLSGQLTITGSSTCAPLVADIARRFETLHPDVRIDVQTGGSSRGIADAGAGLADIGMSSRPLHDTERPGRRAYVLARDGVCFIVHASNPLPAPSDEQIRAVYTGEIDDWSALDGHDGPITVISRADGRSELELVTAYLGIDRRDLRADAIAGENQQGIKQVATDPNAIVYMSVGTSVFEAASGRPIRLLPLRGVEPTTATVASGEFPLSRPLLLITAAEPAPLVAAFVEFARSSRAHDLVGDHAFVPASP